MASRPKFKGTLCKQSCGGHRAGYSYARDGGTQMSPYSSSFNEGMRIFLKQQPRRPRGR